MSPGQYYAIVAGVALLALLLWVGTSVTVSLSTLRAVRTVTDSHMRYVESDLELHDLQEDWCERVEQENAFLRGQVREIEELLDVRRAAYRRATGVGGPTRGANSTTTP